MKFYVLKSVTDEDDGGNRRKNLAGTIYLDKVEASAEKLTRAKINGEILDFYPLASETEKTIYDYLAENKAEWEKPNENTGG